MELALAEKLICPCGASRMPLVVRADAREGAQLTAGEAGCAHCQTEWPLEQSHATFGVRAVGSVLDMTDVDAAVALLNLSEPGLLVWIDGATPDFTAALIAHSGIRTVVADATRLVTGALHIDGAEQVPFAAGTFHAALVLRTERSPAFMTSVAAALQSGGRLVAADQLSVPAGVRVLGRAAPIWVGEAVPASAPVELRRR
jgi:hypothetical protein